MKISSNVTNPDPKKKKKGSVEMGFQKGKTTRTYTPESVETGHKEYGAVGSGSKVKNLLDKARAAKQDIAYDDQGRSYRAGRTVETKEPDKFTMKVDKVVPNFKPVQLSPSPKKDKPKAASGKKAKLKPMGMTYGTDSPSGGGTRYKKKERPRR